jgi:D-xylonolactonase
MQPKMIADTNCHTGENPLWHPDEQCVYWVDIPTGRLFRYDPARDRHEQVDARQPIGGFTLQEDGALLLFMDRGGIGIWRDGDLTMIVDEIPAERDARFNDVIADPAGRVYCGTMSNEAHVGRLYRLDTDGTLTVMLEDVRTSNGMGFTPDRRTMYYTETGRREITCFDYDQATGDLTNRRVFARVPERGGEGKPDGMTVDAEGCVWSARWDGHCVVRYAPDGTELQRITFPVPKVSCPTFGGPDYGDLYVTTAGGANRAEEGNQAGALFRVRPGVQGVPEFRSKIGL